MVGVDLGDFVGKVGFERRYNELDPSFISRDYTERSALEMRDRMDFFGISVQLQSDNINANRKVHIAYCDWSISERETTCFWGQERTWKRVQRTAANAGR